jgi:hypothetical protein
VISGVTDIAHITTKQDMSRWTRAHADVAGITWSVFAGPGGTMIIVEHAEDRCSANRADPPLDAATAPAPAAGPAESAGDLRVSALRAA